MHGIKNSNVIAYNQLVKCMKKYGYYNILFTTVLWSRCTLQTKNCLCADNFGAKYFHKDGTYHILSYLEKNHSIYMYWVGKNYLGPTINFNDEKGYDDISMPKYHPKALSRFQYPKPKRP